MIFAGRETQFYWTSWKVSLSASWLLLGNDWGSANWTHTCASGLLNLRCKEVGSGLGGGSEAARSRLWGCRRNAVCRGGVWDRAGSAGNGFFRNSGSSPCPYWPSALLGCWLCFQLHSGPFPEPAAPPFPSDSGGHHVAFHYTSFTTARVGFFIFFFKKSISFHLFQFRE